MEKVICEKCGYETCYNDIDGWKTIYLQCLNCGEIVIDKDVKDLKVSEVE